jgi:hypothetical protein
MGGPHFGALLNPRGALATPGGNLSPLFPLLPLLPPRSLKEPCGTAIPMCPRRRSALQSVRFRNSTLPTEYPAPKEHKTA